MLQIAHNFCYFIMQFYTEKYVSIILCVCAA